MFRAPRAGRVIVTFGWRAAIAAQSRGEL